jgi:serine phosphatase RsbU (regulator of sigma subunit)/energy-coupling factor transporter transmembrane protein EcfT
MGSPPVPVRPSPARRVTAFAPAAPGAPRPPDSPRRVLLHSWAGRLFLVSALLKLLLAPFRAGDEGPVLLQVLGVAATLGLIASVGYFTWRLGLLAKQRLLWRVRRKLILSYIFMGLVPAALIIGFFVAGASIISLNVSAYMFKNGYEHIVGQVALMAEAGATEIARSPAATAATIERVHRIGSRRFPRFAIAFVPMGPGAPPATVAGVWEPPPPSAIPAWLPGPGFVGTVAMPPGADGDAGLVIRAAVPARGPKGLLGYVIAETPVDTELFALLRERTGVLGRSVTVSQDASEAVPLFGLGSSAETGRDGDDYSLFRHSLALLDAHDWTSGQPRGATVGLDYTLGEIYERVAPTRRLNDQETTIGEAFVIILVALAGLLLIIQLVALVMGLALARSITSSIHELFRGTERVRQGDFTHRIDVTTKDQLGELAGSFNQMTASIEGLLQTAAEKKRLEEELRIARQIQMSLLPRGPLQFPGLGVTALCVPAREVGGDYYDFFPLPNERLGVLIADVSGKGTSAALYMAELKGLVLALSQTHGSPRALLIDVNRIISEHLDSRSFITMTYAVIDMKQGTMTYCRAGHTPLIYRPGPASNASAAQVLTPSGMVLGLRIPGAAEKFDELLHEDSLCLSDGDVIVLYTDGISEAMNADSDLFGDARLGRLVEEHGHLESGELRERILRELEAFVGPSEQHDDMTMILLKVERAFAARMPAVAHA